MLQKVELFVIKANNDDTGNCDYYILEGAQIRHQCVPAGRIMSMVNERADNENFKLSAVSNEDDSEVVFMAVKGLK